jgi:hypothetical protein
VLMDSAGEGRWRPGLAESADLIGGRFGCGCALQPVLSCAHGRLVATSATPHTLTRVSRPARMQAMSRTIMKAMNSWRNSASPQAQDDLDGLLNVTLPFAQQMLAKYGEFHPFGAFVTAGGETQLLAGDLGQGQPATADLLSFLVERLRQERATLRAIALCADVRLPDSDAVRIELEHEDGHAMAVLMPYQKERSGAGIKYADLRGVTADKRVWT